MARKTLTTDPGVPVIDNPDTLGVGQRGQVLLFNLHMEKMGLWYD